MSINRSLCHRNSEKKQKTTSETSSEMKLVGLKIYHATVHLRLADQR